MRLSKSETDVFLDILARGFNALQTEQAFKKSPGVTGNTLDQGITVFFKDSGVNVHVLVAPLPNLDKKLIPIFVDNLAKAIKID